jgi:hypothetical protein
MSNSYRIRTTVGKDTSIKVNIEQDFEYLEILSLKLLQSEVYTRQCSDYGVVVGRVSVNNGFGLPNAKVSIFIPLSDEDSLNPIISELYPYKTLSDVNDEGYRYNLLPYTQQHTNHTPTGTFFEKTDMLLEPHLIEVFDKYYKYTTTTNDSGDFMLFGVPVGQQTLFVDLDLSDIGEFSLTPQDLIRMGMATEGEVGKIKFKSSTNLDSLPQLITFNRNIEVEPFWGQPDICSLGITRTDFDLTKEAGIDIKPTAIFMGSIFSSPDEQKLKKGGKVGKKTGELCSLITGPGEINAIRQTINLDNSNRPILESFELDNGGQVIDDNGTWLLDVPMNLDYITTDEYGNRTISYDPQVGIPTRGKYRFKVKWNQPPTLEGSVKRGYFLVPNVREYGWGSSGGPVEPGSGESANDIKTSYAFSLDWRDYGYTGNSTSSTYYTSGLKHIEDAINCEDKFYDFTYNKVYTVSELISQYRVSSNNRRYLAIKDILNTDCEGENNKFPSNDGQFNNNVIFTLFRILLFLMYPIIFAVVTLLHILSFIVVVLLGPLLLILTGLFGYLAIQEGVSAGAALLSVPPNAALAISFGLKSAQYLAISIALGALYYLITKIKKYFTNFKLPNYTFPDCDFCECAPSGSQDLATLQESENTNTNSGAKKNDIPVNNNGTALLTPFFIGMNYSGVTDSGAGGGALGGIFGGQPIPSEGDIGYGVSTTVAASYKHFAPKTCDCGAGHQLNEFIEIYSPGDDEEPVTNYWGMFSTDLPLPERINLFNIKAKYFNNTIPNSGFNGGADGGQGVNQIKVRFDTTLNPSPSIYHLDNVIALFINSEVGSSFTPGKLVTFQDSKKSTDINLTGSTQNEYGTFSISGESILSSSTPTPVNVEWANPNGVGSNNITTYNLTGKSEDVLVQQFPMDVEYFQVITGMTYGDYKSKVGNTLQNSLYSRYLNNNMYTLKMARGEFASQYGAQVCNSMLRNDYNPMNQFNDNQKQFIVFLVRGVDPHSSRTTCEYDLSKLFGFSNFGNVKVSGQYKLNIPIQGSPRNVRHEGDNHTINSYSNTRLFHKSYNFKPLNMTGFTTTLTQYYSGLNDKTVFGAYGTTNFTSLTNAPRLANDGNDYITRWLQPRNNSGLKYFGPLDGYSNNTENKPCYYVGEDIEGGSHLVMNFVRVTKPVVFGSCKCKQGGQTCVNTTYICPKITTSFTINPTTSVSNNYIVMRSDRLPLSTFDYQPNPALNSFRPLHANVGFEVFVLDDTGLSEGVTASSGVPSNGDGEIDPNSVLSTLECGKLLPLSCYESVYDPAKGVNVFRVKTGADYNDCKTVLNKNIMEKGCYVLVTTPFLSIVQDFASVNEWRTRMLINFAACQNVFSHVFTNNWVNGTLFAFPFANVRKFDSNNKPSSVFATDLIYLDKTTNNFYYRSAPYTSDGKFVGQNINNSNKGNKKLLNFPTTIMDLGPRDVFTQEVAIDDTFDGYIVNKLESTTFSDTSDLLNLFILNRLTSSGFLNSIASANINTYFSRNNSFIDGDFAQMNAINSEFGVVPFESEEYVDDSQYSNPSDDSVIGVFFSSSTQNRDFITPKRNLFSEDGNITDSRCYSYIPVKTQEVPFYQWNIANGSGNVIFGQDDNEWFTEGISGNVFFSYRYQQLDRLKQDSRYFRTNQSTKTKDFKGYIYSINNVGKYQPSVSTWSRNNPDDDNILTGAPFYFYFGLKRGKTAFDRFGREWLDFENIEE